MATAFSENAESVNLCQRLSTQIFSVCSWYKALSSLSTLSTQYNRPHFSDLCFYRKKSEHISQ